MSWKTRRASPNALICAGMRPCNSLWCDVGLTGRYNIGADSIAKESPVRSWILIARLLAIGTISMVHYNWLVYGQQLPGDFHENMKEIWKIRSGNVKIYEMQQEMQNMWNKYEKQYNLMNSSTFHIFRTYFSYLFDIFRNPWLSLDRGTYRS